MTDVERCLSEIAKCVAEEGHPAWQVAIGHADWAAELWMIEREAARDLVWRWQQANGQCYRSAEVRGVGVDDFGVWRWRMMTDQRLAEIRAEFDALLAGITGTRILIANRVPLSVVDDELRKAYLLAKKCEPILAEVERLRSVEAELRKVLLDLRHPAATQVFG